MKVNVYEFINMFNYPSMSEFNSGHSFSHCFLRDLNETQVRCTR